jgi:hypothetical protein
MVVIVPHKSYRIMKDAFGMHKVKIYNDNLILKTLLGLRIKAQKRHQDSLYAVCGLEGTGKSNFTLLCAELYGETKGEEVPIENITRSIQELMNRIAFLKGNAFLTMDEGSELSGDRSMEKKAKEIKEYFTIMRKASFIILICFTNPLKLGTYFREDRIRGVFFMKRPGEVWYYANSPENPHFTNILERWGKDYDTRSIKKFTSFAPNFIFKFPEYEGVLREPYEERKNEHIQNTFDEHAQVFNKAASFERPNPEIHFSLKQAREYLGVSGPCIYAYIGNDLLHPLYFGVKRFYLKNELDAIALKRKKN